jgi:hypothetical protein
MFESFGTWLQEQHDRKGPVGDFARLAWTSFTSGDCHNHSSALEWRDHYQRTLPKEKYAVVQTLLKETFTAYAEEILMLQER